MHAFPPKQNQQKKATENPEFYGLCLSSSEWIVIKLLKK